MKTMNSTKPNSPTNQNLHGLIDSAIAELSVMKIAPNSRIVNNVPGDLSIGDKEQSIYVIMRGLLYALMANADEGEILVSASVLFGNTIKVSARDNNCYNTYAIACALQQVVPVAEKMGGFLNIMNQRQKITTIEFSFPFEKEIETAVDEE
jgi:hypothetical protein